MIAEMIIHHRINNKILLLAILAASIPDDCLSAKPLEALISSRSTWSSFDWNAAHSSAIWTDENFATYKSSNTAPTDDNFYKNQKVKIGGRLYNASLVQIPLKEENPQYLTIATQSENRTCSEVTKEWSKRFGDANLSIDNSYKPLENYPIGKLVNAWRIGNTTVISKCTSIGSDADASFHIEFRPSSYQLPEPPFHLTCSREFLSSRNDSGAKKSPLTALSIIPDERVVTDASGILIFRDILVTESYVEWTMKAGSTTQTIHIDRTTGALSGRAILTSNENLIGTYQGECVKRAPGLRRF